MKLYDICIHLSWKNIFVLIVWVCCLNMNYMIFVLIGIMFVVYRNDVYFLLSMMSDIYFRLGQW